MTVGRRCRAAQMNPIFHWEKPPGQTPRLFKIVNYNPFAGLFEDAVEEFDVQRVGLIIVLRFFVGKDDVERDLVGLIDDRAGAGGHFPGVKMQAARNGAQIFFNSGQEIVGRLRLGRVSPKNNNV